MSKPREKMEPYTFDAELSLSRMAVMFAGRHPTGPGCGGLVHQVRRVQDRLARLVHVLELGFRITTS